MYNSEKQYNKWFISQPHELRPDGFKWNVENFIKLIERNNIRFKTIIEIGGAEGTNLSLLKASLPFSVQATNCDISGVALMQCKKKHPDIIRLKRDVTRTPLIKKYDVMLLSDIIEHIPDDEKFLRIVSKSADLFIIKLPIERVFWNKVNEFLKRKVPIGPAHPSGHLHEYTRLGGLTLLSHHFDVIDRIWGTLIIGTGIRPSIQRFIKTISPSLYFAIFGGALFVLAKTKVN